MSLRPRSLIDDVPLLNMPPSPEASPTEKIRWAIDSGLTDQSDAVREQAAALLDEMNEILSEEDIAKLTQRMRSDSDEIVQYRMAIALYRCGQGTEEVEQKLTEGLNNPEVGSLIKSFFHQAR